MMNKIKKIISKLFGIILPFVDRMAYLRYFDKPFTDLPILSLQGYYKLAEDGEKNTYSIEDVDLLEKKNGYSVNKDWLNSLALHTQIVVKKSELNYAHGRILYTVLRHYLTSLAKEDIKTVNIIETGTARGFSALCMAKALSDSKFEGSICTVDVLPHYKKMFWNCSADHTTGKQTRQNLLSDWADLTERYIIFMQGFVKHILPKIALTRIHFAFLDGAHTYEDVLFEFNNISKCQKDGDIIVFDDYNERDFPGIVKAVNYIGSKMNYSIKLVQNKNTLRDYVIAKKTAIKD
jgi:predicted O-methyltransferase YrrM